MACASAEFVPRDGADRLARNLRKKKKRVKKEEKKSFLHPDLNEENWHQSLDSEISKRKKTERRNLFSLSKL